MPLPLNPAAMPLLCHSSNPPVPASGAFAGVVPGAGMTSDWSTGGSTVLCPDTRATLSPAASPSWLGFPRTSSSIRLNDLFLLFLSFLWGWFQFTPCCVLGWWQLCPAGPGGCGLGVSVWPDADVCSAGDGISRRSSAWSVVGLAPQSPASCIPLASSLALRGHPR